jgi:Fe-S oxidoreductase
MTEAIIGIDARRTPPAWTRQTFRRRFDSTVASGSRRTNRDADLPPVRLFVDTFTNYYNPQVGMAGAKVLRTAGLQVSLAPNGCCGRPLISQGLLAEARDAARFNTDRLHPLVKAGARLVFFEPSCLSAIREDVPSLLRGDEQRQAAEVAAQSMLFEELLERHLDDHPAAVVFAEREGTIVLHGHCHQKAMGLLPPARALLSRIPRAAVVDLDAGCCGMAGSFGYAVEHFDVSRAIGERRLLPAARRLGARDVLVAAGVSCRHQIADFASAHALHPAELLGALVQEPA